MWSKKSQIGPVQCRLRQMKGWSFMNPTPEEAEAIRLYIHTGDCSKMKSKPDPVITDENFRSTRYYY